MAEILKDQLPVCGIVMPISSIDGLPKSHWEEMRLIIEDAIENAGFLPNLVSNSEDIGVIHKRIIQNLYENPIVVCDVSAKNPNVMFELGIRLAFDKPTIIIKDDATSYNFDTSPIEHLEYPRNLRYNQIIEFKTLLERKVKLTFEKSQSDPNYSTFLKHFGTFKVPKIETEEISSASYILEELKGLRKILEKTDKPMIDHPYRIPSEINHGRTVTMEVGVRYVSDELMETLLFKLENLPEVSVNVVRKTRSRFKIDITCEASLLNFIHNKVKEIIDKDIVYLSIIENEGK